MTIEDIREARENALAVRQQAALAPVEDNILAVIARAAADPTVDVAKMRELFELKLQVEQNAKEDAYYAAMGRLQPRLPRIKKGGRNDHTGKHYSRYEDIDAGVRALMTDEGFWPNYTTEDLDGNMIRVVCTLCHVLGHRERNSVRLPVERATTAMNATQAVGSAMTYARRMLLTNALNLVSEGADDDAVAAGGGGYITDEQVMDLQAGLTEVKADFAGFCKFMRITKLEELPANKLKEAWVAINQKRGRTK